MDPEIAAAIITAVGGLVCAGITALATTWAAVRATEKRVGASISYRRRMRVATALAGRTVVPVIAGVIVIVSGAVLLVLGC